MSFTTEPFKVPIYGIGDGKPGYNPQDPDTNVVGMINARYLTDKKQANSL